MIMISPIWRWQVKDKAEVREDSATRGTQREGELEGKIREKSDEEFTMRSIVLILIKMTEWYNLAV